MSATSFHFLFIACIPLSASGFNLKPPQLILRSDTQLTGSVEPSYPSVHQFLGIPFAEPPIGNLRWEPPQPNNLPSFINATSLSKSCKQPLLTTPSNIFTEDVPEFLIQDANNTSEDCLTLSVWTPEGAVLLPVIVFLYGGGFYSGGQRILYQIPTQWVQRTKDLIVVVPNFRANIFGFPNALGVEHQNLGILDQRLAVKWVHENIAFFGGDPTKITLWGHSSGAEAVDMYNYAWLEDTIVKGLIMNSGTALIEDTFGSPPRYSNFSYVAGKVGCGNGRSDEEELACMKEVDADVLTDLLAKEYNEGAVPALAFGASMDDTVVFLNHTERMLQGKHMKVPSIIGTTTNDGTVFVPYNTSGIDQSLANYYLTTLFLCPAYKTATLRASNNVPTYRFVYAGNFSNISPRPWMGAYHSADLPLLFGTHGNFRGLSTPFESAVSEAMQDAWRAFADDPWGGLKKQGWLRYSSGQEVTRWFAYGGEVATNRVGALRELEKQC